MASRRRCRSFSRLPTPRWHGARTPAWPGAARYGGVERVRHQVILDRMDTLDFDQETEDLIDAGDKVVVLVRWRGRGRARGGQGEISLAMVWTVREQAITSVEFFLDRARALEAVGRRSRSHRLAPRRGPGVRSNGWRDLASGVPCSRLCPPR